MPGCNETTVEQRREARSLAIEAWRLYGTLEQASEQIGCSVSALSGIASNTKPAGKALHRALSEWARRRAGNATSGQE